ncbi:DNA-3-methyladenine glycosylase [Actinokineospora sp. UTMC 2448]|nr:DNA-3-methyladenine glycosylase [Actinokineospora sp. UTMC 2448]
MNSLPDAPQLFHLADPGRLVGEPALLDPLRTNGTVMRLANPDLWDALATGIVRQVIRAGQARLLYREFCRAHGDSVETPAGPAWLFPSPDTVLALPDAEFTRLGMSFKRAPLRAAADAYLARHRDWAALTASDLVAAVQDVPRIGPWTAGAAVADATNDFSLYPFADLAVRTWARRLAPAYQWPQSEPEFAAVWRGLAGEQLSDWTLLTLAWGVRHAQAQGAAAL